MEFLSKNNEIVLNSNNLSFIYNFNFFFFYGANDIWPYGDLANIWPPD